MSSQQILAGFHAVQARLRHAPDSIRDVYLDTARQDARMQRCIEQLEAAGVRWHAANAQRLEGLAHAVRHQGIVALARPRPLAVSVDEVLDAQEDRSEPALLLVLDGVTDPHNLGACLRTADAAGVHAVIAPKDRAVGLNATVQRVACGAADTVPYLMVTNLARTLRALRERDIWLVGTDDAATHSLHQVDARRPMAWVMGAEGEGMRRLTRETCDELVSIPMQGSVESLNVSVAGAVCLYDAVRQRLTPAGAGGAGPGRPWPKKAHNVRAGAAARAAPLFLSIRPHRLPMSDQGFTTRLVHADHRAQLEHGAIHQPIHPSTEYAYADARELAAVFQGKAGYTYARQGTPTTASLEGKITDMEHGLATVTFATGMAALNATFFALLRQGDHLVASKYIFGNTNSLLMTLENFGVELSLVDATDATQVE